MIAASLVGRGLMAGCVCDACTLGGAAAAALEGASLSWELQGLGAEPLHALNVMQPGLSSCLPLVEKVDR